MKRLRKVLAKAENPFRSRDRERSQEFDVQRTESRLPAFDTDNDRLSGPSKNAEPPSSYQSSPDSLGDRIHRPGTHYQAEALDTKRPSTSTEILSQPMKTYLPSSSQPRMNMPVSTPTPWEAWKLDQDFLYQVYSWNVNHPENNLNRVFKKISAATEQHGVLFELLPDGPIPIRGFVKALAHIVKLGVSIADAKVVALQFAQSVLQWVEQLATALGAGSSGRFISSTWDTLADIRQWIENVCTWAHRMLNVRLVERASVTNKILELQQQFTQAIERFGVVSNIQLGIGQDHIHRRLDSLNMHITTGQDQINQKLQTLEDRLPQHQLTIPDATYEFQNKIPCNPGTRKQVLEEIITWICDISEDSPCFFWLSGDPGVGKSAVTASTAQECNRRKILWAQFFINRNDAKTIDPQFYFPSIVKQMSEHKSAVGHAIQTILKERPNLTKDDMAVQATELFLKAVWIAAESSPSDPIAIVIDALDETDVKRLKVTAEIFSRIIIDLPHNVKVFISSRVEGVIRDNFAHHPRARNIHLSARTSVADVTQFLEMKVQEIMADYKIKSSEWGQERMQKLCSQASGLFVWAVTAAEYIRSEIKESGRECLGVVLDELNAKGTENIDMLYQTILRRTYRRDSSRQTDPWQAQRFRRIVGAILVQTSPLSIADLQGLLDLRNPISGAPVDVEHFVRRLRTLLVTGVGEVSGRTIPHVHKSFADFITSVKAEEFHINLTQSNGELALRSIDQLVHLWKGEMPTQLHYAIPHWSSHLARVVGIQLEAEEADDDAASIYDAHSLSSNTDTETGSSIPVIPQPMVNLAVNRGMINCVSVSPDGSRIAYARENSVLLRDIKTGNFIGRPFSGHDDDVNSATFSPDGKYIASASYDGSIRVWDIETGKLIGEPFDGHQGPILSATFSPDGSQIVSASADKTVRIWDVDTGRCVHILGGHPGCVYSAFFSPSARHIVSASPDTTVWDALTGGEVHAFNGPPTTLVSALFSPDGKHVLTCSSLGVILVWDLETRKRIPDICTNGASLSFNLNASGSEPSSPHIITPHITHTALQTATPFSSFYSFGVGGAGIAGGTGDTWLYYDSENKFTMSTYLGQLTIQYFVDLS